LIYLIAKAIHILGEKMQRSVSLNELLKKVLKQEKVPAECHTRNAEINLLLLTYKVGMGESYSPDELSLIRKQLQDNIRMQTAND
jgi:hypothetical protein